VSGTGVAPRPVHVRDLAAGIRLTPAQRRVLGTLIEHAAEVPFLSASELAALAGVSQPSVTRLAVTLGFDGYAALRDGLRTRSAPGAGAQTPAEQGSDRWSLAVDAEAERLGRCRDLLADDSRWAELGAALVDSAPLVVAGLRASGYLARYFTYLARKVHPEILEVVGDPDSAEAVAAARERGATVAVVVCMPRYPNATVELLGWLDRQGYRILLVSDDAMPPLPKIVPAWHLGVPVGTDLTFDSHPGALMVLNMLVEAMCNAAPNAAEHRLERLDAIAAQAGTYWAT